ncbi:MAG: hypothetical protein NVSMB25_05120 [Thermoleophilaceae bacterium]
MTAVVALVLGLVVGAASAPDIEATANRFARAWARGDYSTMYRMLTPASRRSVSLSAFATRYRAAAATATAIAVSPAHARGSRVPVAIRTRIFGTIRGQVRLRVDDDRVDWRAEDVFPELGAGERLTRDTRAPPRAPILARDGRMIAEGPVGARTSPPGNPAAGIVGTLAAPATAAGRDAVYAAGFPPGARIGMTGLEHELDTHLRGTPGGQLRAGRRVIASSRSQAAPPLRTTIDLGVQAAAETALAGRLGGIVALDARTAEIRALAGIAFATQPPGSTFKIITAAAALEAGAARPETRFPVETKAVIEGVKLANANDESCGGTFAESFAKSCNSVFAPVGVKVGGKRLVAAAERFGFNRPSPIEGVPQSTLPPAESIGDALAVGSTAIGQGKVLATPLQMALVADAISTGGLLRAPSLVPVARPIAAGRATSPRVAALVERLMLGVVHNGTGVAAAIPGVQVAGKTGTAELKNTATGTPQNQPGTPSQPPNTDAWFAAYAPVPHPRIAVGLMFVAAGAGADVAAPAARGVLEAGLRGR